MLRLISVFAIVILLVIGFTHMNNQTQANVVILSPDAPCELFRNEEKMYETCRNVWEFERSHSSDVQIVLD